MIAYLKGELIQVVEDQLVLEVGQIGYNVCISAKTASSLPSCGRQIQIYTYTCVREDAFLLYGFLTKEELSLFRLILTVNGIGPKGALGILSSMGEHELKCAILAGDDKLIAKSPGIGPKTAARLILELKSKITIDDLTSDTSSTQEASESHDSLIFTNAKYGKVKDEVMQALTSLGYSSTQVIKGMRQVKLTDDMKTEEVLKLVLRKMEF